jgi:hypothetical protein
MKSFSLLILLFLFSCAHRQPERNEELVSLEAALMQAQASYLKGCVDALKDIKVPVAFHGCRDMSILHRQEIDQIMNQPIQ